VSPTLSNEPVSPIERWALDPTIVHLNHGSFGGCLNSVVAAAAAWRARIEAAPMRFFVLDWQTELDRARAALAAFVGAPPERTVFVPSATTGVAIALHSIAWSPGDEIVVTDHGYRACRNQVERLAASRDLRVVVARIGMDPGRAATAVFDVLTRRTRCVLLDHVTSPTAFVLPLAEILPPLAADNHIVTIIDGAHAPGQLPLDIAKVGATYYTGNCHKWMCAPKGAGFLVAAEGAPVVPVVTSHGASAEYGPANRMHAELDWSGTHDPAAYLTVPTAITDVAAQAGGEWSRVFAANHDLALQMRRVLANALGEPEHMLAGDDYIGAMVAIAIELPSGIAPLALEKQLLEAGFEVPIVDVPGWPLIRLSAHLYNHIDEVWKLGDELERRGVRLRAR